MEKTGFEQEIRAIDKVVKEMRDFTDDELFLSRLRFVANSLETLQALYEDACGGRDGNEEWHEDVPEKLSEEEEFALRAAQLAGLSEQFTALGRKRPESACGTFKAQQVNRVLLPLKELIGEDIGLVNEEGEQSYSDVSLLIQGYLVLCSCFALRKYGLEYDIRGREISSRGYGYGHR